MARDRLVTNAMRRTTLWVVFLLGAATGATAGSSRSHVTPIEAAEVRISPNKTGKVTILSRGKNAFFAKLEMEPGAKIPLHRDATEEYVHVLEGRGKMT